MAGTNDVFGYKRNAKPEAVFSNEESTLNISSGHAKGASAPYLIQGWNMNYTQNVEEMFEIGSSRLYWMKGRPVGQGSISRVMGPNSTTAGGLFQSNAYDLCEGGATMTISAKSGLCAQNKPQEVRVVMSGVVVTALGYSMQVPDVRLMENVGWRFSKLELN